MVDSHRGSKEVLVTEARSDLMTVREAAQYLGKTEGALRWQIHMKGDLPPHALVAGRIAFRRSLCDRWLDEKFDAAMKGSA